MRADTRNMTTDTFGLILQNYHNFLRENSPNDAHVLPRSQCPPTHN